MRQRRVSGSGVSGAPWDLTAVRAWQVLGYQDGSLILDIKILGSLLFGPSTIDQCVVQTRVILECFIMLVYTSFVVYELAIACCTSILPTLMWVSRKP